MAFALVAGQTVTASEITGTGSYTTGAFSGAITIGNTIICAISSDDNVASEITSVTDSKGNTYTKDFEQLGVAQSFSFWRSPITVGGTGNTITVNYNGANSNNSGIVAQEWSSAGAFTKDQTKGANGTSATPATGNSSATTVANEIIFAACVMASTEASFTAGAGYSNGASALVSNANIGMQSKTVSATGVQAAGFTWPTSRAFTSGLITYYEASAGTPPFLSRVIKLQAVNRVSTY